MNQFTRAATLLVAIGLFPITSSLADNSVGNLHLVISVITGEHSLDSNSTTTSFTLSDHTLIYERSYHGAHSGRRPSLKKEYKLTHDDETRIMAFMSDKNLWENKTISKPPQEKGTSFYFEITIRGELDHKQSLISIDGSRSDTHLREDANYKDAVSLVDQLCDIIRRTDPEVVCPQLIDVK